MHAPGIGSAPSGTLLYQQDISSMTVDFWNEVTLTGNDLVPSGLVTPPGNFKIRAIVSY
jgi:hypothetical protein